jgi:hypothetical protein
MLDVTGANSSKTEKIANEAGAKGYDVHVIHVDVPSHQIAQRVWERAKLGEGRFVPLKYASDDVDHRPSTTYKNLKSNPYVKSGVSVDNSGGKGSPPRVLDRYER